MWAGDAIKHDIPKSTLNQVMAWCLTAPSHHLIQCWFSVQEIHKNTLQCTFNGINLTLDLKSSILKLKQEVLFLKANELNISHFCLSMETLWPVHNASQDSNFRTFLSWCGAKIYFRNLMISHEMSHKKCKEKFCSAFVSFAREIYW